MAKQRQDKQDGVSVTPSERKSEKFTEARETLPEELREVYDRLVDE